MFAKSCLFIHIALIPLYINIAIYVNFIPSTYNLSSLLRLAKANQILKSTLSRNSSTTTMTSMKFILRKSQDRGNADHGWLKTFHTFSFASYVSYLGRLFNPFSSFFFYRYHESQHQQFGPLRVINEDRVASGTGFGTHSHREFEIFSYVVAGELEQFVVLRIFLKT